MPSRRFTVFVLALTALVLAGAPLPAEEGAGPRELSLGREAAARQDHAAAARHFRTALSSFDPAGDREALAATWLELGLTSLNGLDDPEAALTAFLTSAALAKDSSTAWLWASVAAEKLGRAEEAATYKTRALQRPAPASAPAPAPSPAPVPAPQPEPVPAPEPVREEPAAQAPPAETDAVQHFFGPEAAEKKPGRKKERAQQEREREEPAAPAEAEEPKETVDAVQYFFGEKEPPAAPAEEPPPGRSRL